MRVLVVVNIMCRSSVVMIYVSLLKENCLFFVLAACWRPLNELGQTPIFYLPIEIEFDGTDEEMFDKMIQQHGKHA